MNIRMQPIGGNAPRREQPESEVPAAVAQGEFDQACHVLACKLLGLRKDEPVLVYFDAGSDTSTVRGLVAWLAAQGYDVDLVDLSSEPDVASMERTIKRHLAPNRHWVIVEASEQYFYDSPVIAASLMGGMRMLSIGNLSLAAFCRCIGGIDAAWMNSFGATLRAIIAAARSIDVRTGGGSSLLSMRATPNDISRLKAVLCGRSRSMVYPVSPLPLSPGQMAFLPGQLAFLGVPETINGTLVVDGYWWPPSSLKRLHEPVEVHVRRGRVVQIEGGAAAQTIREWLGPRDTALKHCCIGFHPQAEISTSIVEAERRFASFDIGFGTFPFHTDGVVLGAEVHIDGIPLIADGRFVHPELTGTTSQVRSTRPTSRDSSRVPARRAESTRIPEWIKSVVRLHRGRHLPVVHATCGDDSVSLLGNLISGRYLAYLYLGGRPRFELRKPIHGLRLGRNARQASHHSGLVCVGAHPAYCRAAGLNTFALRVPSLLIHTRALDPATPDNIAEIRNSRNLEDLRKVRRAKYAPQWSPYTAGLFSLFYENYYAPTVLSSHREFAGLGEFGVLRDKAMAGEFLLIRNGTEIEAIGLFIHDNTSWRFEQLGLRDGSHHLTQNGAGSAVYYFGILRGMELGCREMVFGRSVPILSNGVVRYKAKWGCQIKPCGLDQPSIYLSFDPRRTATVRMLEQHPIAFFDGGNQLAGLGAIADPLTDASRLLKNAWLYGLRRYIFLLASEHWRQRADLLRERAAELKLQYEFVAMDDRSPEALVASITRS